jgi:hypothetical protein
MRKEFKIDRRSQVLERGDYTLLDADAIVY